MCSQKECPTEFETRWLQEIPFSKELTDNYCALGLLFESKICNNNNNNIIKKIVIIKILRVNRRLLSPHPHQNIRLHTNARVNVVLLIYLFVFVVGPLLSELHWLPVSSRLQCKIASHFQNPQHRNPSCTHHLRWTSTSHSTASVILFQSQSFVY